MELLEKRTEASENFPRTHSSGHFKDAEVTEMVRAEETICTYLLPDLCHQQALLKLVLETHHQQYLWGRNTRASYQAQEVVQLMEASFKPKRNLCKPNSKTVLHDLPHGGQQPNKLQYLCWDAPQSILLATSFKDGSQSHRRAGEETCTHLWVSASLLPAALQWGSSELRCKTQ